MKILALDPATKCGWAHSDGKSGTWDMSVRRDESAGMKLIRLRGHLDALRAAGGIDLVVFEAARHAGPGMQGALVCQAELQSVVKVWATDHGIEYRGYSPSEIKKHATGKGNAGKDLMKSAAAGRWVGRTFVDDNEIDATWLLDLATGQYAGKATSGMDAAHNGAANVCAQQTKKMP